MSYIAHVILPTLLPPAAQTADAAMGPSLPDIVWNFDEPPRSPGPRTALLPHLSNARDTSQLTNRLLMLVF